MRIAVAAMLVACIGNAQAATVIAAVTVNGFAPGIVLQLDQQGDHFTADADALNAAGLVVPAGSRRIDLATLPGVTYIFHADTQTLAIRAEERALKPHNVGRDSVVVPPDAAAIGALVNYGVAGSWTSRGAMDLSGNLEFRAFAAPGVFESNWYGDRSSFHRLDT